MEKDDEVKLNSNSYSTEFREYDPRIGRWLSIEPLAYKFPSQSPYVAFDNNPILKNDLRGDSPPTVEEVIKRGEESPFFSNLTKQAGITNENANKNIAFGNDNDTYTTNTKITLISNKTVYESVIRLAHELTNKIYSEVFKELDDDVTKGQISPEEYATQKLCTEVDALFSQIAVGSELGIKIPCLQKLEDKYKKGESVDKIKKVIEENIKNATGENGENAFERYKNEGTKAREAYLKAHPADKQKSDDPKNKSKNPDGKKTNEKKQ